MNYDEARPLKDGGWHWTTMNDGMVRTAAPCIQIELTKEPIPRIAGEPTFCPPHETREAAERHFYDHCLGSLSEATSSHAERCATGCGEWTDKALENRGLSGYFRATWLCDEHRTKEKVAELHPFKPGIQLVHS